MRKLKTKTGKTIYIQDITPRKEKQLKKNIFIWDFCLEDILDEAIDVENNSKFYHINDRYYETTIIIKK
jgi:hypothetical protein